MIVLDASAAVDLVLETDAGFRVGQRLAGAIVHVPAHFDVEAVGVIRRFVGRGEISERDGHICVDALLSMPLERWEIPPLVDRAFSLHKTHTMGDAVYIALAEGLGAPLLTTDHRLARSHGHEASILVP